MAAQGGCDREPWYFSAFAPLLDAGSAALVMAENQGHLECALLLCAHHGQVTLHLGATCPTRTKHKKMLLPIFAAADWAHDRNATVLDLGGVPAPEDTNEKRRKIAQFKHDFASEVIRLTPAMISAPTSLGKLARRVASTLNQ
jgi:hypothetical protein